MNFTYKKLAFLWDYFITEELSKEISKKPIFKISKSAQGITYGCLEIF